MKKITLLLTMTILSLGILVPISGQSVGEELTNFTYSDLSGTDFSLSDFEGKVVFLFLFGNDCPFCKAIGNDTETKVNQEYKSSEYFQALGLDLWDGSSSVSTVTAFKNHTGITYPLLLKAGSFGTNFSTTYDRVIVIDHNGIIRHKGATNTASDLDNAIDVIEESLLLVSENEVTRQSGYTLSQNYPNPVTGSTTIRYSLESPGRVNLTLYNTIGEELLRMVEGYTVAGSHDLQLSLENFAPGIYFYQLNVNDFSAVKKLIIK